MLVYENKQINKKHVLLKSNNNYEEEHDNLN